MRISLAAVVTIIDTTQSETVAIVKLSLTPTHRYKPRAIVING